MSEGRGNNVSKERLKGIELQGCAQLTRTPYTAMLTDVLRGALGSPSLDPQIRM
ncbi:hypothetical protein JYU34_022748 [Plutella xylostella]|uniref:Uncharacterized protein n=1 Tax=Plutella xylostella TaxID=51655 RepID=A0ABQ7PPF4_PLUXY|nr:hypothetical protein JYU34_022748 [Plutella xylostella]